MAAGRQLFCTVLRYRRTNQNKTKQKQKKQKTLTLEFCYFCYNCGCRAPGPRVWRSRICFCFFTKKLFKLTVNISMRKITLEVEYLKKYSETPLYGHPLNT